MSQYKSIQIDVSDAKARKIASGKAVNLTAREIAGRDEVLHLHPVNHAKLMKAKKAGKGCRLELTEGEIIETISLEGGSIFKSIWNGVKSLWKPVLKPALSFGLDRLQDVASDASGSPEFMRTIRQGVRQLTGVGVVGAQPRSAVSCGVVLIKGSPEAKAHMAALRARKQNSKMTQQALRAPSLGVYHPKQQLTQTTRGGSYKLSGASFRLN